MNDRMNDIKTKTYGNEKLLAIDYHIPGWDIPKDISLIHTIDKEWQNRTIQAILIRV